MKVKIMLHITLLIISITGRGFYHISVIRQNEQIFIDTKNQQNNQYNLIGKNINLKVIEVVRDVTTAPIVDSNIHTHLCTPCPLFEKTKIIMIVLSL